MQTPASPSNPSEIAREVIQRLSNQKIPPTPEAYTALYNKISGQSNAHPLEEIATRFASDLADRKGLIAGLAQRLEKALIMQDWPRTEAALYAIFDQTQLSTRGQLTSTTNERQFIHDSNKEKQLRELLVRIMRYSMASLLKNAPELNGACLSVSAQLEQAYSESAMSEVLVNLKDLTYQIELKTGDMDRQQALFTLLFQLLLENIHALLDKDSWLSGQITAIHTMISSPVSAASIEEATKSLKEVIYKQGILKDTLNEEKLAVKNLMLTFVERLTQMASSTDSYYESVTAFSKKVNQATDIGDLNSALTSILEATREAQKEAITSRDNMAFAQFEVQRAAERIINLEKELAQMSELVCEDHLTGSLNRRGLDESLEREINRATRFNKPLCVALLDLDDFKKINDTYGHTTGDEVLVHLVSVIKDTLRKLDVIARFGGEEFLVLLPETPADDALKIVTRIQRELTKRIFMHDNLSILITFSAGVASMQPNESQKELLARADNALYEAKRAGKNRVILAR